MKLLNTISIEPWDYTKNKYQSPDFAKNENPEEWSDFWYKCISDSNLKKLTPIELASYLIDINTIEDDELQIIIKNELKEVDLSNYQEYVNPLKGGIVVLENNKIILKPTCCGDLSDIENWNEIKHTKLNKWTQLWIGHPWLFYIKTKDYIAFSEYSDSTLEDINNMKEKYRFPEQALLSEIKLSYDSLIKFENRISKILNEMGIKNAKEIAKLMIGKYE